MYVPKNKFDMLVDIVRHCDNLADDNCQFLNDDPLPALHFGKKSSRVLCGSLGTSESVYEMARQVVQYPEQPQQLQMHYFPEDNGAGNMIVAIAEFSTEIFYCGGMTDFSGTGGAARQWMIKMLSLISTLVEDVFVEQIYHNSPLEEMWKSNIQ